MTLFHCEHYVKDTGFIFPFPKKPLSCTCFLQHHDGTQIAIAEIFSRIILEKPALTFTQLYCLKSKQYSAEPSCASQLEVIASLSIPTPYNAFDPEKQNLHYNSIALEY